MGWPYKFLSRRTTRSSISSQLFGLCRGRIRIQMSGHSSLGFDHFHFSVRWSCVTCFSSHTKKLWDSVEECCRLMLSQFLRFKTQTLSFASVWFLHVLPQARLLSIWDFCCRFQSFSIVMLRKTAPPKRRRRGTQHHSTKREGKQHRPIQAREGGPPPPKRGERWESTTQKGVGRDSTTSWSKLDKNHLFTSPFGTLRHFFFFTKKIGRTKEEKESKHHQK